MDNRTIKVICDYIEKEYNLFTFVGDDGGIYCGAMHPYWETPNLPTMSPSAVAQIAMLIDSSVYDRARGCMSWQTAIDEVINGR